MPPMDLHLLEGSFAYFPCISATNNIPIWRINGQLYDSQFLPNGFSFNTTGLIINNVTLPQSGMMIQCILSADTMSDVVILTVYSKYEIA